MKAENQYKILTSMFFRYLIITIRLRIQNHLDLL